MRFVDDVSWSRNLFADDPHAFKFVSAGRRNRGLETLGSNECVYINQRFVILCFYLCFAICSDSFAGDLKPYPLPPATRTHIENLAASSDILILGEIHGTQEVPELAASLLGPLGKLGYHTLAFEVPNNYQASLLAWLHGETARIPNFFTHPNGDGRGNAELLTLARIAASPPFQWQIICFDESESVTEKEQLLLIQKKQTGKVGAVNFTEDEMLVMWRARDAAMASNLLSGAKLLKATNKILAICGNLHARTSNDIREPMLSKLWPSFAGVLKQRRPDWRVGSVNIEFYSGAYFNNGKVQTIPKRPLEHPVARPAGQTGWDLVLSLPAARPATLLGPVPMPLGEAGAGSPAKANQR